MIKPGALLMAVAMAAVTAGTYFGLDLLPPGALPGPLGRTVAEEPAPPAPAPAETEVAAAAPAQPAPAAAPTEQPVTEQDLAEEPAPAEQAAAPAAEPAPAPAAAAPAPVPEPAPAAEPEPPAPKPKAAAKPKPAPESEPQDVASAEPPAPKKPVKAAAEADIIKPWWPDASKMPANQLKLQYAGQVQGQTAIALLFSAPLNLETVKQYAEIKSASGADASGEWGLGKNPRLAVFSGLTAGRYTVILKPEIADDKGITLGTTLQGPVNIKQP